MRNHSKENMYPEGQVVREGWLQKASKPSKVAAVLRIMKTNWKRYYFILLSGSIPGQCKIEWYSDDSRRRKRLNSVNLDDCSQVDSYLTCDDGNKTFEWIFSIRLGRKDIFLVASDEGEMNGWVHDLCHVCNLVRDEQDDSGGTLIPDADHAIAHRDIPPFANGANAPAAVEEERMLQLNFGKGNNANTNNNQQLHLNVANNNNNSAPKGYEKLEQCISAPPRPRQASAGHLSHAARTRDCMTHQSVDVLVSPSYRTPPPAPVHVRTESNDSNSSSIHLSADSDNSEQSVGKQVSLDAVPPPPRPPRAQPVWSQYQNASERVSNVPLGYNSPSSVSQTVFGSLPRPAKAGVRQVPEYGSLPRPARMHRHSERTSSDVYYESLSAFNSPTAETSYHNLSLPVPNPPTVDRSTKPKHRPSHDEPPSPDPAAPPLPPKPSQTQHVQNQQYRITKRDSFVRRERSQMQQSPSAPQNEHVTVPRMLPRNGPPPKSTIPCPRPRASLSESSSLYSNSTLSVGGPECALPLEYVLLQDSGPPSARSPSPGRQLDDTVVANGSIVASPKQSQYIDIDSQATKALEITLQTHRTLERDHKKKK